LLAFCPTRIVGTRSLSAGSDEVLLFPSDKLIINQVTGENISLTAADQKAFYDGFLGGIVCQYGGIKPIFVSAWSGHNEAGISNGDHGLLGPYSNNYPTFEQAWGTIQLYYPLTACP
jgi:hypothetical protein